ncbi:MAG: gliding motility-associated C-terminal domain-containing protein [Cyclobacteriaceae bacterium]|nr:gliding motility-associated C-terminal domain-containing protein [Cyclobacteriaceae bacterium]
MRTHCSLVFMFMLLISVGSWAQGVIGAEYFFDTDPGKGNATPITLTPSGSDLIFTANIPTATLSPGFHFLGIRIKETGGLWSVFESRGFYITSSTADVPNITAAEYFFDTDPGEGNGTAIPVTAGPSPTFTVSLPTTGLAPGFHFLAIRTKRADGTWGIFESRGFYVTGNVADVPDITAAEYFFDTDPGEGNGTAIPVTAGPSPTFTINLPTTALAPGFHFLAIRTKRANGTWGIFESRGFYVTSNVADVPDITAAEYFFDTDLGEGNGTAIPVTAGPSPTFTINLPTTALAPGFHFLAIRTKRANGTWGIFESRGFYVTPDALTTGDIVAAEFFIDGTDPGEGNGEALVVGTPGPVVNQVFEIPIISVAAGEHTVSMRVKDADGTWSEIETRDFTVLSCTPPPSPVAQDVSRCNEGTVTLTATGAVGTQEYRWYDDPFVNNLLFTGSSFETPELSATTTYYVSIFDPVTLCESNRIAVNANVTVIDKPVINPSGTLSLCEGNAALLAAPEGFSQYTWSNGQLTQQILVNAAGTFTVQTGNGTCTSEVSEPVTVVIISGPPCSGGGGGTSNSPPQIQAQTFTVQIEGQLEQDLVPFISDPDNNIDFTSLRVINNQTARGAPATIDAAYNLLINYQGDAFTGTDRVTIEVCDLSLACAQQVFDIEITAEVVVFNGLTPDGDGLNDFMFIKYLDVIAGADRNKVTIFNRWGDVVFDVENYNNTDKVFNGLSNKGNELPSGTYFYKIEFTNNLKPLTGFLTLIR